MNSFKQLVPVELLLSLSILSILFITLTFLIIFFKSKLTIFIPDYNSVQKIHNSLVPPFGGIIIALCYYSYLFFYKPSALIFDWYILFPAIFILFVGIFEDIKGNVSANVRFFIIFIASIIYLISTPELPKLEVKILGPFLEDYKFLKILFFAIGLTALSNGLNMIDGMNGLAGFTALSTLVGIASILVLNQKFDYVKVEILSLSILVILFLLFNFPFGKIFLGDAGAYWLGWILGVFIIDNYVDQNLNSWGAILLIFYPCTEVLFSTIRKLLQGKSPLKPDNEHLHIKLYYVLKGPSERNLEFNSFTTLCLMPFWFCSCIAVVWVHFYSFLAIYFIFIMAVIYSYYYIFIPKPRD